MAAQWQDGLAGWDIEPARIAALRDAAEFTIYTPGSTAGVPLNMVGSLRRPAEGTDEETVADEVEGYVSGLLGMVGVESDPLSGREHILLANLIHHAWAGGADLDLATLVAQVQEPPLRKLGVYETDTFFPPADRTKLAMTLNGLLASRTFARGPRAPTSTSTPCCVHGTDRGPVRIVSLAHLDDGERQFVVSLLLGKLVTWMRRQPGTDKLRVLVYFDEVVGFVPPTAAPPAKKPILTLFKQARAFGVGMVLATQNPVDVDYKGLSNAGTWMIGRLQTEQDKARLLDGLSSAGGGVDVGAAGDLIGSLDKRQFMLREPGASAPSLFTTPLGHGLPAGPTGPGPDRLADGRPQGHGGTRRAGAPAEVPASPSADTADATGAAANAAAAAPGPTGAPPPADAPPPPPHHPHPRPRRAMPAPTRCPSLPRWPTASPCAGSIPPRRGPPRRASAPPATRSPPRWSPGWPCCSTTTSSTYGTPRSTRPSSTRSAPPSIRRPPSRSITTTATCAPSPRRRHLPGHRRAARLEDLVPRRRQGARRPPVPQPHDAGAAQPRAEAGRPRRRERRGVRRPLPGRRRRGRGPGPGQAAAALRGAHRQGPHRARQRRRPGRAGPGGAADPPQQRDRRRRRLTAGRRARRAPQRPHDGRDVGRVLTGRSRSGEASQRVETARNRVADHQQALADLEADLARSSPPSTTSGGRRPPRSRTSTSRSRRATSG